jgi:hypothetical protein
MGMSKDRRQVAGGNVMPVMEQYPDPAGIRMSIPEHPGIGNEGI